MSDEIRNKRLRLLISRFNKQRKQQAKQIDILCNDIIAAQKDFIKALKIIGFAADFYGAITGITDLNELLCTSGSFIQKHLHDVHVAFFLKQSDNFELHVFENEKPINLEDKRIENFFSTELVSSIGKSNRICGVDDMLEMGLQCSPTLLEKISMAAMPLSAGGSTIGFVLIYRSSHIPLTIDELKSMVQVTPGLGRAIDSCRNVVSSI